MKDRLLICLFLLLSYRAFTQPCTLTVKLSQSAPAICSGSTVVLTATTSGGTAPFTYIWSTGETTPSVNVNKAGTYTVTVSDKTPGCQPVKKSITVVVSVTPVAPTAAGVVVCPNSPATLKAIAPGGTYQWYDKLVGGNFLATGATYITPSIAANTVFYVETTVNGCTSARTAVPVSLIGKPTVINAAICGGNVATLSVSTGDSYTWYDAPVGGKIVGTSQDFTTPVLSATTTYYVVVALNGCASAPTPVTAFVTAAPQAPTAPNVSVCSGSSANLHAAAPSGVFNWFTVPTGGIPLISSPDYTTPPLTANTTYYVETALNGCESPRTKVTVTVNPLPATPPAHSVTICYGTSASLAEAAPPSGTYQWYDAAAGGNLLATGLAYTTPALTNSTTYYIQTNNGGCVSARTTITVTVSPQLAAPTASGSLICMGSAATLTATAPGGTYTWYNAAVGGNLLATGASYTTPALNTATTYYVQTTTAGCTSPRTAVTVSILPATPPPTASGTSVCLGSTATLSATGSAGGYGWYASAAGGALLSSAQVYVTPALAATTTYYVESTVNGCSSTRTPIIVTVNAIPSTPTATASVVPTCAGTSATLTATAAVGTIQWYDAPNGGNLLATGNTYNTPALTASTTYYVQSVSATCTSPRVAVTATVNSVANPQFQYSSGTFCAASANAIPVINNPAGGTFSASPAGLVFVNANTGQINIAASAPNIYTVSFTSNGPCVSTTSAQIAIVTTINPGFSYNGPFCQGGANPFPAFSGGASAGNYSATPAGLVFVNTTTGEIDLSKSNFGTYTVTNTIAPSGACLGGNATATVTINQAATVNAGPNQTVSTGTPVQLAGSVGGGAVNGKWSGGTGNFSNPNLPNAVYTPGPGETSVTLTLTATGAIAPCGPQADQVTINIIDNPVAAAASVCPGSGTILSATAPGGTYRWYSAPAGGTLLTTGPNFTTPALVANTTYYVQTTIVGVTSNRTAVTVTVNGPPAPPAAPAVQVCTGNAATLTASGSAGTYRWYDAAAGGNLLSVSNTFTTPFLTSNATYYVEAELNGCVSTRTAANVTVMPVPVVTSLSGGSTCSGNALNYTITADIATATFNWSRAQMAGISNPAAANQTTATIAETLINTTPAPIKVTYVITPTAGLCPGAPFNYVVTVLPTPTVSGPAKVTVCNMTRVNYSITFNTPATAFSWSRAVVPGISNTAISGQTAQTIREVLFNTTNAPVNVSYIISYGTSTCPGAAFNLVVTVEPTAKITSNPSDAACSGVAENYVITSNVANATYNWSRAAVPNVSNPAVTGQTSGTITETLVNTGALPVAVIYFITPFTNGCEGTTFRYVVGLNPPVAVPTANSNSPVCVGTTLNLQTAPVLNAAYAWTGPNGFKSALQNPNINNVTAANAGTYTLVVTVNGCTSVSATTTAVIDAPPVANAGPDQTVCIADPAITLAGSITGGTTTGIWTTAGTGTFTPSANALNAQYIPSLADETAGGVVLTLSSTSNDNCTIATSKMTIKFSASPAVNAGPDQALCSQVTAVKLNGSLTVNGTIQWTSTGTGTFGATATQLDATYNPSAADEASGSVTLVIHLIGAGVCNFPTDSMTVKFIPPPTVNAGGTRDVLQGSTITLNPVVSDNNLHYLWSPDVDINNDTLKNPTITGTVNRTYTLTVTDERGCVAQDTARIIVSPPIVIDNTFTPNGDGTNDLWNIKGIAIYTTATVDIFNRWGQKVFHSLGYPKEWDGTYDGKALPTGVYYYIINTNFKGQVLSGWVALVR